MTHGMMHFRERALKPIVSYDCQLATCRISWTWSSKCSWCCSVADACVRKQLFLLYIFHINLKLDNLRLQLLPQPLLVYVDAGTSSSMVNHETATINPLTDWSIKLKSDADHFHHQFISRKQFFKQKWWTFTVPSFLNVATCYFSSSFMDFNWYLKTSLWALRNCNEHYLHSFAISLTYLI